MAVNLHLWLPALTSGPVLGLLVLGFAALTVLAALRLAHQPSSKKLSVSLLEKDEKVDRHNALNVFPPSRRSALAQLLPASKIGTSDMVIPLETLRSSQIPTNKVQPLNQNDLFTSTSILTQEVEALGRFPDYSVLSGVPHPQPAPLFDISKATFRPFRPFRWSYHQTMAVMKYEPDYWIELEQNYFRRMDQRMQLWKEHGERVMFEAPGSELACRELMEMVLQFLTIRYPHYFQLEDNNRVFHNQLLKTTTVIDTMKPLELLFRHVPEDFAIMLRDQDDGNYYLRAALVCSSVGWNVGSHKNKLLRRIHDNVPLWEKMAFSVDRYLTKQPCDAPIQRGSWGIEDWEAFFCPEDMPRSMFEHDPSSCKIEDLQLRCDWQTLRRLPLSGAVIFNFKAVFTPLTALADEPYVPALLHRVITQGDKRLIDYKMEKHVADIATEHLGRWARKQEEDGVVEKGWEVGTLEQSPFFPGWQDVKDWGDCPMRPSLPTRKLHSHTMPHSPVSGPWTESEGPARIFIDNHPQNAEIPRSEPGLSLTSLFQSAFHVPRKSVRTRRRRRPKSHLPSSTMPSVKNPNGPSKNRLAARRASARKATQKSAKTSKDKIVKADQKRGAGGGLLPTSGPRRQLSAKKQKKVDRQIAHALKRKMEAEGEVEMKDAAEEKPAKDVAADTEMDEEIS